jgi:hypothetical protein
MAKYRGRVDCYFEPPIADGANVHSRANGEFFVSLVRHISSSMPDLGIEMLAWSYGGGSGWNYWDEHGTTGRNAFAVFRFHSASLGKFDCFIYENTGSFNSHTASLALDGQTNSYLGETGYHQIGISFACHPSSSVIGYQDSTGPWNGGLGEEAWVQTSGPIWKLDGSSKGAFFPRPNSTVGNYATNREYMTGIPGYTMHGSRSHFILSEDSITIFVDDDMTNDYKVVHFGSYTPRSGCTPNPESPYLMWTNGDDDNNSLIVGKYGTVIGSTATTSNTPQGAIAHPDLTNQAMTFSWNWIGENFLIGLNPFIEGGTFEKFPLWVMVNEGAERGTLGVLNHIYYGIGMPNLSVSSVSGSAAIGKSAFQDGKLLVPWSGAAPCTTLRDRNGRNFSIG